MLCRSTSHASDMRNRRSGCQWKVIFGRARALRSTTSQELKEFPRNQPWVQHQRTGGLRRSRGCTTCAGASSATSPDDHKRPVPAGLQHGAGRKPDGRRGAGGRSGRGGARGHNRRRAAWCRDGRAHSQ
jgi:hypothetical protein